MSHLSKGFQTKVSPTIILNSWLFASCAHVIPLRHKSIAAKNSFFIVIDLMLLSCFVASKIGKKSFDCLKSDEKRRKLAKPYYLCLPKTMQFCKNDIKIS